VKGVGFRPFAIRAMDGQKFQVPYPEMILAVKNSIAIRDKRGLINNIDVRHVVSARAIPHRKGEN
jgi:hypothetical protein